MIVAEIEYVEKQTQQTAVRSEHNNKSPAVQYVL